MRALLSASAARCADDEKRRIAVRNGCSSHRRRSPRTAMRTRTSSAGASFFSRSPLKTMKSPRTRAFHVMRIFFQGTVKAPVPKTSRSPSNAFGRADGEKENGIRHRSSLRRRARLGASRRLRGRRALRALDLAGLHALRADVGLADAAFAVLDRHLWMLGRNQRFVTRCEWLMLRPATGAYRKFHKPSTSFSHSNYVGCSSA